MNKWIAEFELEDGDSMPEHMDLYFMGARLDFHCKPVSDCIPIPKDATNGDVIKAIFPNLYVEIEGNSVTCWIDEKRWVGCGLDWWNEPYNQN